MQNVGKRSMLLIQKMTLNITRVKRILINNDEKINKNNFRKEMLDMFLHRYFYAASLNKIRLRKIKTNIYTSTDSAILIKK